MRVAVVHNRRRDRVLRRRSRPSPERYGMGTVRRVVDALESSGHDVAVLDGDVTLLGELGRFLGADPGYDEPDGLVFNMAYGIQGDCRYTHVPAMLEMAGVPYTGSDPLGHAVSLDKAVAKELMLQAGIPTPPHVVMAGAGEPFRGLAFPLVVKPRHESTSYGLRLVTDREELDRAVARIGARYRQSALVEAYVEGREVCVGLLGNDPPEVLPPVELDFSARETRVVTVEDKFHRREDEPARICPAPLERRLATRVREIALATFRACRCRDYARVDIRVDRAGRPWVLEVNSMASLGAGGSYVLAASEAGYGFEELVARIVEVAVERSPAGRERGHLAGPRDPAEPVGGAAT